MSAGEKFRAAVEAERPLQVVGVINAYAARMAERVGYRALYVSGAGVANASYGLPDLGFTTLADVIADVKRIAAATALPLLVDVDTGWEDPAATVRAMIEAGSGAMQIEDQISAKRCGHRPNKQVVSTDDMVARLRTAVTARTDPSFVIMARTDAVAMEGLEAAISRARRYVEAGADMIFAEALASREDFAAFARALPVPVLANMTEFGKSPLLSAAELGTLGIRLALYPLSAFRAMNAAALNVFQAIRQEGGQQRVLESMQTRAELYEFLGYEAYEREADARRAAESRAVE
ncbi:MAG: methylisocitrate lyase [Lentisphaerae bacterium]|nr:methylisocitrate lyase [Lentisphaerota bacterium]